MSGKILKEKPKKIKIELDEDIVLRINALKQAVGETYSDVLRRLLK